MTLRSLSVTLVSRFIACATFFLNMRREYRRSVTLLAFIESDKIRLATSCLIQSTFTQCRSCEKVYFKVSDDYILPVP